MCDDPECTERQPCPLCIITRVSARLVQVAMASTEPLPNEHPYERVLRFLQEQIADEDLLP